MKNKKLFFYLISIMFLFGFGEIAGAAGASVYVYPGSGDFKEDEEFSISIGITPGAESVDMVKGSLALTNLVCQSVSLAGGISPVVYPSCSDLSFTLGIQGGTTVQKTLFTIKVKTLAAGSAKANLSIGEVLSEGNSVSFSQSSGSYAITSSCVCGDWGSWQKGNCGEGGCDKKRVYVRTRSCEPAGCNAGSETKCVEDSACVPKPEAKITIAAPTGLSGYFNADDKTILISWKASPAKDISGYFILRKPSSETYYKLIGTVSATALNYRDDSIEIGKTYDYSVVAFKGRSWNNSTRSGFSTKTTISAKEVKEEIKEEKPKASEEIEVEEPKEEKYSAKILPLEIEEPKTPWLSFFGLAFAALSIGGFIYYWKLQENKLKARRAVIEIKKDKEMERIEKNEENDIIDLRKFKK